MSTNAELIARYDRWSERPMTGSILQSERFQGFARELRDALKAAEAELTRLDTVIANAIEVADELFGIADVNYEEDNYDAGLVRAAAEIKTVLAAAPVSLEAVKAETTDRRPHSRACGFRKHEHGTDCNPNCQTCHGRSEAPHV